MDTYKYIKSDGKNITIEFAMGVDKLTKTFDIRYIPTDSKESLREYCDNYIIAYKAGKAQEQIPVSDEVTAIKGSAISVKKEILKAPIGEVIA